MMVLPAVVDAVRSSLVSYSNVVFLCSKGLANTEKRFLPFVREEEDGVPLYYS